MVSDTTSILGSCLGVTDGRFCGYGYGVLPGSNCLISEGHWELLADGQGRGCGCRTRGLFCCMLSHLTMWATCIEQQQQQQTSFLHLLVRDVGCGLVCRLRVVGVLLSLAYYDATSVAALVRSSWGGGVVIFHGGGRTWPGWQRLDSERSWGRGGDVGVWAGGGLGRARWEEGRLGTEQEQ